MSLAPQVAHFIGELTLMKQNFISPSNFRVQRHLLQHLNQQGTHATERVDLILALAGPRQRVERLMQAVEHGLEQVGLVTEMPIDRTPGHPRHGSDVGQGGTRYAALMKGLLCRFENLASGFLCFLFGTTDHGSSTSIRITPAGLQAC
ncbi:hypothetical protein D9M73_137900 [compost metagenome]